MSTTLSSLRSAELFETAQTLMPGGVNSPVRAFRSVGGSPRFIKKAQGAYVWDEDDNKYIDYVGSWGPMILGHAHPHVIEAIREQALSGTSYGAPTALENEMAQLVIDAVPSIEMVRFVNSGTEAVLSAIRLARAYTGRNMIIKFIGCYHGHTNDLLVKAGSGVLTLGLPDSPGVPKGSTENTLLAEYNNLDSVRELIQRYGQDIACILLEPVTGNMGCVPPEPGFLGGLRDLAHDCGGLLVFDEVMTGFRVSYGGAQAHYNVMPDITTLGKIVGGGLPVGAYGASRKIMETVAPAGPMYQAGTLSGNPLAMRAGIETLRLLQDSSVYDQLEVRSRRLMDGMRRIAAEKGMPIFTTQVGSMFTAFFNDSPVRNFDEVMKSNQPLFNQFFHHMLDNGVYLAPSAFESGFMSVAHTDEDIDRTLAAFQSFYYFAGQGT